MGGWCSIAIMWPRGWRVMERSWLKEAGGGEVMPFSPGHWSNCAHVYLSESENKYVCM